MAYGAADDLGSTATRLRPRIGTTWCFSRAKVLARVRGSIGLRVRRPGGFSSAHWSMRSVIFSSRRFVCRSARGS